MKIEFAKLGMPVFTGRDRGENARKALKLDDVTVADSVDVVIPEDVYTVTSSYFLGLFGPSIRSLGLEKFQEVFHFSVPDFLRERVSEWSLRAVREKRDLFRGA